MVTQCDNDTETCLAHDQERGRECWHPNSIVCDGTAAGNDSDIERAACLSLGDISEEKTEE